MLKNFNKVHFCLHLTDAKGMALTCRVAIQVTISSWGVDLSSNLNTETQRTIRVTQRWKPSRATSADEHSLKFEALH